MNELPTDRELINAVMNWEVTKWRKASHDLIVYSPFPDRLLCISCSSVFDNLIFVSYGFTTGTRIANYNFAQGDIYDYNRYYAFWRYVCQMN